MATCGRCSSGEQGWVLRVTHFGCMPMCSGVAIFLCGIESTVFAACGAFGLAPLAYGLVPKPPVSSFVQCFVDARTFCQPFVFTHSFSPRSVCVGFLDRIACGFCTELRMFLDRSAEDFWPVEEWGSGAELRSGAICGNITCSCAPTTSGVWVPRIAQGAPQAGRARHPCGRVAMQYVACATCVCRVRKWSTDPQEILGVSPLGRRHLLLQPWPGPAPLAVWSHGKGPSHSVLCFQDKDELRCLRACGSQSNPTCIRQLMPLPTRPMSATPDFTFRLVAVGAFSFLLAVFSCARGVHSRGACCNQIFVFINYLFNSHRERVFRFLVLVLSLDFLLGVSCSSYWAFPFIAYGLPTICLRCP